MQVHLDTPHPGPGDIHAICNPGGQFGSFAVVKVGPVEFYLHDDADCDALIIAVTDAKRMLQAAVSGECHPFGGGPGVRRGWCARCGLLPGEAIHYIPGCPSVSPDGDACTEAGAHQFHYGPDDDGMRRMWTDADALAASIATGQPIIIAGDEPPCGLRLWGDTSLCELPAGHDPLPSCKGTPRPFARTTAAPSGGDPEPGSQAYADKYASRTVQRGLPDGGELPRRVVSLDSRMGFVSRLDGAKVRTGGEL